MKPIYNIQILGPGGWNTGFCGRIHCSLGQMLDALALAMPSRKLRVYLAPGNVTRISVY